ncbi:MAG: orotidine-5'-phosphate decarboxylase [Synergistales bacterium]|nr:orotidine-5'-phosphate decarboxylase [Synergistales bacterium]
MAYVRERNPVILALDITVPEEALAFLEPLAGVLRYVKIGPALFLRGGIDVVRRVQGMGFSVFLDLKLHDIPNTVALAVESLGEAPPWSLTLHASGGAAMLRRAVAARDAHCPDMLLFGVSVLTSFNDAMLQEVSPGVPSMEELVVHRARLCAREGLDGLVCSPRELRFLPGRGELGLARVVPGIRPRDNAGDDQRRTATPAQAYGDGADYLVVGRPIREAADPAAVVESIVEETGGAREHE